MLTIKVEAVDLFDENTEEFITTPEFTIELEHSLASISKWEETYEKPFLSDTPKTREETFGYIQAMCLGEEIPMEYLEHIPKRQFDQINTYLTANRTATWFNDKGTPGKSREVITSEVVYYWMVTLNIPFECDKWYFNRLLTLIKVVNSKNATQKPMPKRQMADQRRALNEARLKQFHTNG